MRVFMVVAIICKEKIFHRTHNLQDYFTIFTQGVKCKTVQEICPYMRDSKNPTEVLDLTAMPCTSLAEDLEPIAMSMSSTGGLDPMTMSHAGRFQ